jgi:hypothetical protein
MYCKVGKHPAVDNAQVATSCRTMMDPSCICTPMTGSTVVSACHASKQCAASAVVLDDIIAMNCCHMGS